MLFCAFFGQFCMKMSNCAFYGWRKQATVKSHLALDNPELGYDALEFNFSCLCVHLTK